MVTAAQLRDLAMSLPGTIEAPHFDRQAFKVHRIYVTLAADGQTGNLMLTPDEQSLVCEAAPAIFYPVDNAWGRKGATTIILSQASLQDLASALQMAYAHAVSKRKS